MQSFEGCILLNCATGNIAIAAGHVLGRSSTSLLQHYLMFSVVRQTMEHFLNIMGNLGSHQPAVNLPVNLPKQSILACAGWVQL